MWRDRKTPTSGLACGFRLAKARRATKGNVSRASRSLSAAPAPRGRAKPAPAAAPGVVREPTKPDDDIDVAMPTSVEY